MTETKEPSNREKVRAGVHEYEEEAAAEIERGQTGVVLQDVGKQDGDFLNEDRVEGEKELNDVRQV